MLRSHLNLFGNMIVLGSALLLAFITYTDVSQGRYANAAGVVPASKFAIPAQHQLNATAKHPPGYAAFRPLPIPVPSSISIASRTANGAQALRPDIPQTAIHTYTSTDTPQTVIRDHPAAIALRTTANSPEAMPETAIQTYETTAYYLNVREEASIKSNVLRVVEKGTRLEVLRKTGNGWLELSGGGYVHGAYARLLQAAMALPPERRSEPYGLYRSPGPISPSEPSVPAEPTSAVQSDSGLTEDHIGQMLKGTALEGQELEPVILEIEDEYGINAYFTVAVMKLESGNGKSRLAQKKNNLFGLNATGEQGNKNAFAFETKADCIRKFGQLISSNYVDKGLTTVEKVARKYCPANAKWSSLVKQIMNSDRNKI